jgi:hypothetical protein
VPNLHRLLVLSGPVRRTEKRLRTEPDCNRSYRTFGPGSAPSVQCRSSVRQLKKNLRTGSRPVLTGFLGSTMTRCVHKICNKFQLLRLRRLYYKSRERRRH